VLQGAASIWKERIDLKEDGLMYMYTIFPMS
jgi:hypothetical protein